MIRLPIVLTVAEAEAIAGTLSKVSAMPGYSYSLDARRCRRGSLLRAVLGSVCSRCYVMRGAYVMPHVRAAQAPGRRQRDDRVPCDRWHSCQLRRL